MSAVHRTEAACLLEHGSTYPARVGLEPRDSGDLILAGFKRGGFALYFGDAPFFHFDLEGRWQRAIIEDMHYLKGLDGTVHALDRIREEANLVLKRRRLGETEAAELDATIRATALDLIGRLDRDELIRLEPTGQRSTMIDPESLREFLSRIAGWDAAAWRAHGERFHRVYPAPGFVPPECSGAVVLDVKSPEEFAHSLSEVAGLWGRRLLQAKTLYLAGPLALKHPQCVIEEWLAAITRLFPLGPAVDDASPRFSGVHAYLDDFAAPRPDKAAWARLRNLGLARVSLGVVSGDETIRASLGKTWANHELVQTALELKQAGLGASVLVHVGAGGRARAAPHHKGTSTLLDRLSLGRGDIVFLLDEREIRDFMVGNLEPLSNVEWLEHERALKDALAPLKKRGAKVVSYTMEKQWS